MSEVQPESPGGSERPVVGEAFSFAENPEAPGLGGGLGAAPPGPGSMGVRNDG